MRLFRQWHAHRAHRFDHLAPGISQELFRETEFLVFTPCALHDAGNAFKWAMLSKMRNKDLLRDAYITVESVRNSWSAITGHVCKWIVRRVSFVASMTLEEIDTWRTVWSALDVDVETVDVLAEQLQVRFEGGRLKVHQCAANMMEWASAVETALLSAWKLTKWTESRWMSIGRSSRSMTAALLLGLPDLVAHVNESGQASQHFLSGFGRLNGEVRAVLVESAVFSRVVDGATELLMDDPRVCKVYDGLWQTMGEDMLWVVQLPLPVWRVLASVAGLSAEDLRSTCINSAHVAMHFFWRRVLRPASKRPWSLARGDVRENLEALALENDPPIDPVSWQLWILMRANFSVVQLVKTLKLIADVPWTTMTVEQQHGTMAALRRHHPEYSAETLCARSMVLQLRRLLLTPSEDERLFKKMSIQIRQITAKNPSKAGGKQVLLSRLHDILRNKTWDTREKPKTAAQTLLKYHHSVWRRASHELRAAWAKLAEVRAATKSRSYEEEAEILREAKQLLSMRIEGRAGEVEPLLMSSAALSVADLEGLHTRLELPSYTGAALDRARELDSYLPPYLDWGLLAQMRRQKIDMPPQEDMPDWCGPVVKLREYVLDTALMCRRGNGDETFWKVNYCVQNPVYLAVTRLEKVERAPDLSLLPGTGWFDLAAARSLIEFRCNFALHGTANDMPSEDVVIYVFTGLRHIGGNRCVALNDATHLLDFLDDCPALATAPRASGGRRGRKRAKHDEDVKSFPWLAELDLKVGFNGDPTDADDGDDDEAEGQAEQRVQPDDELFDTAMAELEAARAALSPEDTSKEKEFVLTILGGRWLERTHGLPFDNMCAMARGGGSLRRSSASGGACS